MITEEATKIIATIAHYLHNNKNIQFGQALTNLGINEFVDKNFSENANYNLRDIYNDSDTEILKRMKA